MLLNHIQDYGQYIAINIVDTKNGVERRFTLVENKEETVDYLGIFRKYLESRKHFNNPRFFLRYAMGKCCDQPVGKHTIAKVPSLVAKFLQLSEPELFTGHCLRRTSATLLADSGANLLEIKRHGGWKSSSVAEGYIAESISNKIAISNKIFSIRTNLANLGQKTCVDEIIKSSENPSPTLSTENNKLEDHHSLMTHSTFSNCTINIFEKQ